jgi:hypothetical protein
MVLFTLWDARGRRLPYLIALVLVLGGYAAVDAVAAPARWCWAATRGRDGRQPRVPEVEPGREGPVQGSRDRHAGGVAV